MPVLLRTLLIDPFPFPFPFPFARIRPASCVLPMSGRDPVSPIPRVRPMILAVEMSR